VGTAATRTPAKCTFSQERAFNAATPSLAYLGRLVLTDTLSSAADMAMFDGDVTRAIYAVFHVLKTACWLIYQQLVPRPQAFVMTALWNSAGNYIFALLFLSSFFFFFFLA